MTELVIDDEHDKSRSESESVQVLLYLYTHRLFSLSFLEIQSANKQANE